MNKAVVAVLYSSTNRIFPHTDHSSFYHLLRKTIFFLEMVLTAPYWKAPGNSVPIYRVALKLPHHCVLAVRSFYAHIRKVQENNSDSGR